MTDSGEINVARVIDLCREREVRLAYEIGAFVVFEACEAVLSQPRAVRAHDVWVSPDGATRVGQGPPADPAEAAASLAELLAAVLVVAGQEVPGMLMHLVEVPQARMVGLTGYRDELEAALLPVNRPAARRVLARQLRELTRPRAGVRPGDAGATEPKDAVAADADLDSLLGYDAPPAPKEPEPLAPVSPSEPAAAVHVATTERTREPTASTALAGPGPMPAPLGLPPDAHLDGVIEGRRKGTSGVPRALVVVIVVVIVLAISAGAYLWLAYQA